MLAARALPRASPPGGSRALSRAGRGAGGKQRVRAADKPHVDPRSLSLWVELGNWRPPDWKHEDGSAWLEQREAPSRLLRTQTSCPLGLQPFFSGWGPQVRVALGPRPASESGGLWNCASPSPPTLAGAMRGLDPGILFLLGSRDWGTRGDDGSSSPTFKPQPTTHSLGVRGEGVDFSEPQFGHH